MPELFVPHGYISRVQNDYFDDTVSVDEGILFQPEIYPVALKLLAETGRHRLIDIGCGIGRKLAGADVAARIGIDFGSNIARCRQDWPDAVRWLEANLENPLDPDFLAQVGPGDVVVCSDVIEHLADPFALLAGLRQCFEQGALIVTSTPDRVLVRGADHMGPPPNPAHVREWSTDEYGALLASAGLPPFYLGLTLNNDRNRLLRTIVSIHEPLLQQHFRPVTRRPLAILACYNEADVIRETVTDLIAQGCDVHVLDNWSDDGTWQTLAQCETAFGAHLQLERFPEVAGPRSSWHAILRRKEAIAACHKGRWIIHTDADELRRAPVPGFTLADGLAMAEAAGWDRVQFTLLNYRATDERDYVPGTLLRHFTHFEFGTKPGHFNQRKAWLQGSERVDLAESGGHVAEFDGARDCPYHFVLHHFPLRSVDHARRKIGQERLARWSEDEQAKGWHRHYADLDTTAPLVWDAAALHVAGPDLWREHGLAILTGMMRNG